MNVCTNFYADSSNNCYDISVCTKVWADRLTNIAIPTDTRHSWHGLQCSQWWDYSLKVSVASPASKRFVRHTHSLCVFPLRGVIRDHHTPLGCWVCNQSTHTHTHWGWVRGMVQVCLLGSGVQPFSLTIRRHWSHYTQYFHCLMLCY